MDLFWPSYKVVHLEKLVVISSVHFLIWWIFVIFVLPFGPILNGVALYIYQIDQLLSNVWWQKMMRIFWKLPATAACSRRWPASLRNDFSIFWYISFFQRALPAVSIKKMINLKTDHLKILELDPCHKKTKMNVTELPNSWYITPDFLPIIGR